MMRAIGDQVAKNPEYLSILDKKAIHSLLIEVGNFSLDIVKFSIFF